MKKKKKCHSDLVSETRLDSTRLDSTSVLGKSRIYTNAQQRQEQIRPDQHFTLV